MRLPENHIIVPNNSVKKCTQCRYQRRRYLANEMKMETTANMMAVPNKFSLHPVECGAVYGYDRQATTYAITNKKPCIELGNLQ